MFNLHMIIAFIVFGHNPLKRYGNLSQFFDQPSWNECNFPILKAANPPLIFQKRTYYNDTSIGLKQDANITYWIFHNFFIIRQSQYIIILKFQHIKKTFPKNLIRKIWINMCRIWHQCRIFFIWCFQVDLIFNMESF